MTIPTKHLVALFHRSFSAATAVSSPTFRCTNQIRRKYQLFVVQESQKALREYLHATQGLPFFFADQIANNSLFCLSNITRDLPFSVPAYPTTIRKALRYQVINEFEFFLESIGIDHRDIARYLPRDRFFLSDNGGAVLEAAAALFHFGFPWNTLGKLYTEEVSIFNRPSEELMARLGGIGEFSGFHSLPLVGACLAFPDLLVREAAELGGDFEALFKDLKKVFEEFDKGYFVEWNVDGWYEVCSRIRFLYELGCERGTVWELMCRGRTQTLLELPTQVLEDKAHYFSKFGAGKDEVRSLLLRNPELLRLDLQTPVISVSGLLEHFGLDAKELRSLSTNYPHVFGRNKMGNLPGIARALDLHKWFFEKFESLGCQPFATYAMDCSDQEVDKMFRDALKTIESKRYRSKIMTKLDLLMRLGFGENASTLKVLHCLEVANNGLQERFDNLLSLGIKYSEACSMIRTAPRILCVSPELVEKKVEYLCNEMGSSIEHLYCFPRFLLFDLEKWIKPRHRFSVWLRQTGFMANNSSIQSVIDLSEKRFIARISTLHRAAPKLYLECYLCKS